MHRKLTTDEFIEKSKKVHGNKYDYSKTKYVDTNTKVTITCPKHGDFEQYPTNHYKYGCKKCAVEQASSNRILSEKEFIERCKEKFGDKYDFSITKYTKMKDKVKAICPIHGEFEQYALALYRGIGCGRCKKTTSTEDFIAKAKIIHGNKYDYSEVKYEKSHRKIYVICPKHGRFPITPNNHLHGKGCPVCNESKLEQEIRLILDKNKIKYKQWHHFKWLGKQSLDFYLTDYNIGIECQGGQHFINENFMGGIDLILKRDNTKNKLCKDNGVLLFYYFDEKYNKYYKFDNEFFNDKNKLIAKIKTFIK